VKEPCVNSTVLQRLRAELARAADEPAAVFAWQRDVRLSQLLRFHYETRHNRAYRQLLHQHGITSPTRLPMTAAGLEELPIVEKDFLRAARYDQTPAVPRADVRFVVCTSGSTGAPMNVPQSHALGRRAWGEMYARILLMAGREDLLDAPGYFVAHFNDAQPTTGTFVGMTQMREALSERVIMGNTSDPLRRHIEVLLGHRPRFSCSAPGFYLAVLAGAQEQGLDLRRTALDAVIPGGTPLSPENHARLKDGFGLRTLHLGYVGSELGWMGVQIAENGPYAIFADEYVLEVVDDAGRHVAPGERGRVLVTALGSDAVPLIRYANGDTARYLGRGGPYANFVLVDEFSRETQAIIGDGKVSYDDMASMPRAMAEMGAPVAAFQLAKRLAPDGRDQVHLRVELVDPDQDADTITQAAIRALRRHPHMDFHLSDGELPPPIVETYAPGHLTAGRFKVPIYVDETREAIPARRDPDVRHR
jgi:phenylacetate-coenzyme A ligase PaaK-like adenylate-forming protein